mgnify:CR=1 FL=1
MPDSILHDGNRVTLHRIAGNIGAEIRGLTLSPRLDAEIIQWVWKNVLKYKVVFFREQSLDSLAQEELGKLFGPLVPHPTVTSPKGTNHIFELKAKNGRAANTWHADMTFMASFPKASILRCVKPTPYGGATLWANTANAYRTLPVPLQELAEKLWAIHTNHDYDHTDLIAERDWDFIRWQQNIFASKIFEARHPIVHVHPETGEKCLLLANFIKRISDLNLPDSNTILELFQSYISRPENTVTWYWQAGDIAIWDNRSTQHRATADFGYQERELQRVTLRGDIPVSIRGEHSVQITDGRNNPTILNEGIYSWEQKIPEYIK